MKKKCLIWTENIKFFIMCMNDLIVFQYKRFIYKIKYLFLRIFAHIFIENISSLNYFFNVSLNNNKLKLQLLLRFFLFWLYI